MNTAKLTSNGTGYLEHLPIDYQTNQERKYPLIIFLHGSGECGNGTTDINKVKANGIPKLIGQGHNMSFIVNGVEESFIVISPQLAVGQGGWWPAVQKPFYDYILANYRVDLERVYITGLSLGGQGTYLALGECQDIFAAGAVIAGFGNGNGCTISDRKIPVWGFHGESDTTVKYGDGHTEFQRIGWCQNPVPTQELKWTSYPGIGHNSWDNAYRTDNSLHTPNIYEWLLSKRKAPQSVKVKIGNDQNIYLPTTTANFNVALSGLTEGDYNVAVTVVDSKGNVAIDNAEVKVNKPSLNLALLKPVLTSSNEDISTSGDKSVDGNASTRWSSKYSDPQWLQVDLGAIKTINRVKITWEVACALHYVIQTSNDGLLWVDIKTVTGNTSLVNDLVGLSGSGRFVRMHGILRKTNFGYSIYEFEVYGN